MNWLFFLIEVPICVIICATICKKLDTKRHKKFLEEVHTLIKNEVENKLEELKGGTK